MKSVDGIGKQIRAVSKFVDCFIDGGPMTVIDSLCSYIHFLRWDDSRI
jgi:hypothetical protein